MIHYLEGDATEPVGDGNKIIAHICNDAGGWGAGFVVAISRKWDSPELLYRAWYNYGPIVQGVFSELRDEVVANEPFALGNIQLIQVDSGSCPDSQLFIANMIGQVGYGKSKVPPIRYEAVESCLNKVNLELIKLNATMHAARFGCGLAGGSWEEIEKIIEKCITTDVYIYDYNKDDAIPWKK